MSSHSVQSSTHKMSNERKTGSETADKKSNGPDMNDMVDRKHCKKKLVRKQPLASNLKYTFWLLGHILSIVFGLMTFTWQCLMLPNKYYINSISYRLSFLGSVMALAATMSKKYGLHFLPAFSTLLAQQNFQYLVLAVVWCFTFKSVFKVIPTFMISVLQLSLHKKIDVVLSQAEFLASIIAFDELFLIGYLFVRTFLFRHTSGYQLVIVLMFMWLRVLFDKDTANLIGYLVEKADGRMSGVENKKVRKEWSTIKRFLEEKQQYGIFSEGHEL